LFYTRANSNILIKILFFSDTHLGFDFPIRPRIQRRRRGDDFFSNYHLVLDFALKNKVDLVIHGGDMFFRSRIPALIIDKAYEPLVKVANSGIPIYLVPGNHERSILPNHLWLSHENIHVFEKPRTFRIKIDKTSLLLSGFPYSRRIKENFQQLLNQTGYQDHAADFRLLCMHQTFEGAKVGPNDFPFRVGPDNIPGAMIPGKFNLVLSGHIHRGQKLVQTLDQRPLPAPIIYSGSIERTSIAERFENKYFVIIKLDPKFPSMDPEIKFHKLSTRPMVKIIIPGTGKHPDKIKEYIEKNLSRLDPNSVVRIQFKGEDTVNDLGLLSDTWLREIAPATMNISMGRPRTPKSSNNIKKGY
jgi:exonuclease SbcD